MHHSDANPLSTLGVKRMEQPPPFTVAAWDESYLGTGNVSMELTCTQAWDGTSCPRRFWFPPNGFPVQLFAGTSTDQPFQPSRQDSDFVMRLHAVNVSRAVSHVIAQPCMSVGVLPVPLDDATFDVDDSSAASFYEMVLSSLLHSSLCVPPSVLTGNATVETWIDLSFSALQDVHGHVKYAAQTAVTGSYTFTESLFPRDQLGIAEVVFRMHLPGGQLLVDWETQQYGYTWTDLQSSLLSSFNFSLFLVAFLFPWKATYAPPTQRGFILAKVCAQCGHQKSQAAASDEEEEDGHVSIQIARDTELKERMLS